MKKFWEFFDAEERKWPFWLAKIALIVIFYFGSGIYGFFHNLPEVENPDFESREFRMMKESSDEYVRRELDKAKRISQSGGDYTAMQYFGVLIGLDSIFHAHGFQERWENLGYKETHQLQRIMLEKKDRRAINPEDEIEAARTQYVIRTDPDYEENKDVSSMEMLGKIGSWFLHAYLNCMIYALMLFGIWVIEDRRILRFVRRNPLSLICNIIFYPLVIANIFVDKNKDNIRYHYGDAVIRASQDKLFSMMDRDESEMIKQFVDQKLPIAEIRRMLRQAGYQPRRAIAFGLLASVLMGLLPGKMTAIESVDSGHPQKTFEVQKVLNAERICEMNIFCERDDGVGMDFVSEPKIIFEAIETLVLYLRICKERFILPRYQRKIFHIPVSNINYNFLKIIDV